MTETVLMPVWSILAWLIVWRFSLVMSHRARRWATMSRAMADFRAPVDTNVPGWTGQFVDLRKWTYRQFFPEPPVPLVLPAWSARSEIPNVYQAVAGMCDEPVLRELLSAADLLPENTESNPERWLRTVRVVHLVCAQDISEPEPPPYIVTRH